MSGRVLILTAGFGEGHNAAARALGTAFDALHGPGSAEVVDLFARMAPRTNDVLRRGYLGLINRAPALWSLAYRWLDRSPLAERVLRSLRREREELARLLAAKNYTAVCCTYPVYAFLLDDLARAGRCDLPWHNVVTDSISINSVWWRAGAQRWFVPNDETARVMQAAGVPGDRLQVLGFPVAPFFADNAGMLGPPDLQRGRRPRVLYIINSGTRNAAETARRLLAETDWDVTCAVGRRQELEGELRRLGATRRARTRILGWTPEIPRLLMTHHVVISKAGGATTQEALAARCPMIVSQIVPGQEQGNYELLRRHGIGALAETPDAVIVALARAFADSGRVWREWRTALAPLARPNAARDIALAVTASAACNTAAPAAAIEAR